ncbi:MAG: LysR family transcriptional regulator [Pseudomonadota bacterium]
MDADHQPLLFEMLRSFTALAAHLNLSQAVEELGSTRQTVRRHIALLEEAKGSPLFEVRDRQYQLTDAANKALPEAHALLARGRAWLSSEAGFEHGMLHIAKDEGDWRFFLQQQPLSNMWQNGTPFLQTCIQAWAEAQGNIEHPAFEKIRPYVMVFRPYEKDWVCTEVGKQSSYASWFGWEWQKSAVGRKLGALPGGPVIAAVMMDAFNEIKAHNGLRLDHVHTTVARSENEPMMPLSYMRLLLGARYPDGSFALVNIIERTNDIQIEQMPDKYNRCMDPDLEMKIAV